MKWMITMVSLMVVVAGNLRGAEVLEVTGESCRVERDAYRAFLKDWEARLAFWKSRVKNGQIGVAKLNEQRKGMVAGLLPSLNGPALDGSVTTLYHFEEREDYQKYYNQLQVAWATEGYLIDVAIMGILKIDPGTVAGASAPSESLIERRDDRLGFQLKHSVLAEVRAYHSRQLLPPSDQAVRLAAAIGFFRDKHANLRKIKWSLEAEKKKLDEEFAGKEADFRARESICLAREKAEELAREKQRAEAEAATRAAAEEAARKAREEENNRLALEEAKRRAADAERRLAEKEAQEKAESDKKRQAERDQAEGPLTQDQTTPVPAPSAHGMATQSGRPVAEAKMKVQQKEDSGELEFPLWLTTKGEKTFSYLGISGGRGIYRAEDGDVISYDPQQIPGKQVVDLEEKQAQDAWGTPAIFTRPPGCVPRTVEMCTTQYIVMREGAPKMYLRDLAGSYKPWQQFRPSIRYRLLNKNYRRT